MVVESTDWLSEPAGLELLEPDEAMAMAEFVDEPIRIAPPRFPELIGNPFCGAATSADGRAAEIILKIILQTKTGDLGGTLLFHTAKNGGATQVFHFQGALNREGLFVLHGRAEGDRIAVISGTATPDGRSANGNYVVKAPDEALQAGTFCASRPLCH